MSSPLDLDGVASPADLVDRVLGLYHDHGDHPYDETVSERAHAEQAAALAADSGAAAPVVAAAALHDIGHLILREHERADRRRRDHRHEIAGARFLEQWFGPAVAGPVRLHVDAKRYLCATESDYHAVLSPASVHSLALQGGTMDAAAVAAFSADPAGEVAVALRRWDDAAKVAGARVAALESYRPTLVALAHH